MSWMMVEPYLDKSSGYWKIRKVVPAELRPLVLDEHGKPKTSLVRVLGKDTAKAKRDAPAVAAEFSQRIAEARRMLEAGVLPARLTPKDISHLTGLWYGQVQDRWGDDPENPKVIREGLGLLLGDLAVSKLLIHREGAPRGPSSAIRREARRFLASQGRAVTEDSVGRLAVGMETHLLALLKGRAKNAAGDFSADPQREKFAKAGSQPAVATPLISFDSMAERWEKHSPDRSKKTTQDTRNRLDAFAAFIGHRDGALVTTDDAVAWRDSLSGRVKTATIQRKYLGLVGAVFARAVKEGRLQRNPITGARYAGSVFSDSADERRYTRAEVGKILRSARSKELPEYRWLPWVLAYTGARWEEATQCVASDVREQDGVWVLDINDDAAHKNLKGKPGQRSPSRRLFPLHPALVSEGFVAYAQALAPGDFLFPAVRPLDNGDENKRAAVRGWRQWLRGLVENPPRMPAHAFRHHMETLLRAATESDETRWRLQGRADRSSARGYGAAELQELAKVVARIPDQLGG